MKIIHCADLHLDSKMESNLDKDAADLRRDELLETFEKMVDYAEREGVSVILIAGDLFDKPSVSKKAIRTVKNAIIEHPDIDFCYIRGNHDKYDFVGDICENEEVSNLRSFDDERWTSYDYGDVVITGMELTKDNAQTLGMNLVLDQNRLNIVTLHGQESDYQNESGSDIINLSLLQNKYIDYLALGHIHSYKAERLDDRGYYCYSGCLEGRGFDECGKKGFVLLEVTDGKITSEFVPFAKRQFHEVLVEVDPEMTMAQIVDEAKEATASISSDDLIKIILTGKRHMDMDIDCSRLGRNLHQDFFFIKVYDETSVQIDYESFRHDKSLKGEFVRLVEQKDLTERERADVIELGIKAIMGEDLEV